jgi:hypothetical protein
MNKNKIGSHRKKMLFESSLYIFCVIWMFTVFFIDWLLHEMPGLKTPPEFLTQLFNFLTALFSGTYTP